MEDILKKRLMVLSKLAKKAKKLAVKSLKRSLYQLLPVGMEDHILETILDSMDVITDAKELNIPDDEKDGLSSLYRRMADLYTKIIEGSSRSSRGSMLARRYMLNEVTLENIEPLVYLLSVLGGKDDEDEI